MDAHTWRALLRWNPWLERPAAWEGELARKLPEPFVPRHLVGAGAELDALVATSAPGGKALMVVGPRQAGKSSYLWERVRRLHGPCLYLNAEDLQVASLCRSSASLTAELEAIPDGPRVLLIDEAQHLDEAGLLIKGLVDLRAWDAIYVTGSASFHLRSRTRESLAGRAVRCRLFPFSASELLAYEGRGVGHPGHDDAGERIWRRQMRTGAYPEIYLGGDEPARLYDLVEAFVLRDASDLFKIRKPEAFRRLLQLLAHGVGNLVNRAELASICGVSATAIADWIGILEEIHVVRGLPVFAGGKRAELTSATKAFLLDNGVRNLLVNDFSPIDARADRGALLENWVFSELTKHLLVASDLHYWRTRSGAEVDFVLHRPGEAPIGIEVKWGGAPGRLSRSARSFIQAYAPARFVTVTLGQEGSTSEGDVRCIWCHPWRLIRHVPAFYLGLASDR